MCAADTPTFIPRNFCTKTNVYVVACSQSHTQTHSLPIAHSQQHTAARAHCNYRLDVCVCVCVCRVNDKLKAAHFRTRAPTYMYSISQMRENGMRRSTCGARARKLVGLGDMVADSLGCAVESSTCARRGCFDIREPQTRPVELIS